MKPLKEKKDSVTNKTKQISSTNLSQKKVWLVIASALVITFITFSPALKNEFVNWDDPDYVMKQPMVRSENIPFKMIFTNHVSLNYHPLTMLSLAIDYQIYGYEPMGFHLTNIIIHLLNVLLVFLFIYMITQRNLPVAWFVSLFFGIHPMHVESVAWVSERKDVLYVFFFMAGLLSYLQYKKKSEPKWYITTIALFIFSCLSKGMAVVFTPVLFLIDYWMDIKWDKKTILEKIPFLLISFGFGIAAFMIQREGKALMGLETYNIPQRIMFASYGAIVYVLKLFVPINLAVLHDYPPLDSISAVYYLSPVVVIGFTIMIYLFARKNKVIIFGLLFYFFTVALVLQFISVGSSIYSERYSYLCYVGLLFILGYYISKLREKKQYASYFNYAVAPLIILGIITFSYRAYTRTTEWRTGEILWKKQIEVCPDAGVGYEHLAVIDQEEGRIDEAFKGYTRGIELGYKIPEAYNNRGKIYAMRGQYDLALADFNEVLKLDTNWKMVYINLAIYHDMIGEHEKALKELNKFMTLDSNEQTSYANRAIVYMHLGEKEKALKDMSKSIELDTTKAESYMNRAIFYENNGMYKEAIPDFSKVIKLKPDAIAYNMRGTSKMKLNQYQSAIIDFTNAIDLSPNTGVFWLNRSKAYFALGDKAKAKTDALKASQLGAAVEPAYFHSLE